MAIIKARTVVATLAVVVVAIGGVACWAASQLGLFSGVPAVRLVDSARVGGVEVQLVRRLAHPFLLEFDQEFIVGGRAHTLPPDGGEGSLIDVYLDVVSGRPSEWAVVCWRGDMRSGIGRYLDNRGLSCDARMVGSLLVDAGTNKGLRGGYQEKGSWLCKGYAIAWTRQ